MAMMAARAMRMPPVSNPTVNPMAAAGSAQNMMAPPTMPGMKKGGKLKAVETSKNPGLSKLPTAVRNKIGYMRKGGMMKSDSKEDMKMDMAQDKKIIKRAFGMHDKQEHKGQHTDLSKLKKGGVMKKMAKGGETMGPRTMSMDVEKGSNKLTKFGESAVQKRGHTKSTNLGDSGKTVSPKTMMCKGGYAKGGSASKRADGIATKGKTKGRMC